MRIDPRPAILRSFPREVAFLCTIYSSQLLTQAGLGNTISILHYIARDVGIDDTAKGDAQLPWLAAAYSLTVGAFILVTGRLGDVYGHRRLFTTGMVWWSIASLVLGFAGYTGSDVYFDIFRGLQGIGAAMTLPNAVALMARTYPNNSRKTLVFALFGATAPSGWMVGGVFGALFAQFVWWPWAYWVQAAVCLVVAAVSLYVVPTEVVPAVAPGESIDVLGAITAVSGLILFVYAWNEGPVVGWGEPYVYVLLIVAVLLIALFFYVESIVVDPIMPLDIWTTPAFPSVLLCIALGWSSFGIWNFYGVQLIEVFRGGTPLLAVAQFSPVSIAGLVATLLMAWLSHRIAAHWILAIALCSFCIANLLLALCTIDSTYWTYLFFAIVIAPFGMDMSYPAASLIVSNSLPRERQGVGASMINAVINLSVSLGLGIAGTTESRVDARGDGSVASLLSGQRSAVWCGVGLAGLGVVVTLLFVRVAPVKGGGELAIDEPSREKAVAVELLQPQQSTSSAPSSPTAAAFVPVLVSAPPVDESETNGQPLPVQEERVDPTAVDSAV